MSKYCNRQMPSLLVGSYAKPLKTIRGKNFPQRWFFPFLEINPYYDAISLLATCDPPARDTLLHLSYYKYILCTCFVQNSVSHVTRPGVGHQPVILPKGVR